MERQVRRTLSINYDQLLDLATELGFRLMETGAEIYRVEESVQYILRAYGVETGEVFAIPNCLIVSLTDTAGHGCGGFPPTERISLFWRPTTNSAGTSQSLLPRWRRP